ncbi:zinc-ribbon domain-containing protein [Flavobacterium piscinae]|nr:zinc-ribbon domain-containing protein [Flavobacterium piscinae]
MNCKNCQKPLLLEDKFCSDCGAQVVTQKLTVKK